MANYKERISHIKQKLPIQALIQQTQPLQGEGRWLKGKEHDSLIVDTESQRWFWNSQFDNGDHITWIQRRFPDLSFGGVLSYLEDIIKNPEFANLVVETKEEKPKVLVPPNPLTFLKYHYNLKNSEFAQEQWRKRGISEWHISRWILGYKADHWGRGNALSIPFIEDNEIKTIRHRMLNPIGKNRYLPETEGAGVWLFNADILKEKLDHVVLLEGEIKAMVLSGFGENCLGLTGINHLPPRYIADLVKIPKIYIFPDPVLNSKKVVSPYEIGWIKLLYKETDVRIVTSIEKIDDLLLDDYRHYETSYKEAKKTAKRLTDKSFEFSK